MEGGDLAANTACGMLLSLLVRNWDDLVGWYDVPAYLLVMVVSSGTSVSLQHVMRKRARDSVEEDLDIATNSSQQQTTILVLEITKNLTTPCGHHGNPLCCCRYDTGEVYMCLQSCDHEE